MPILPKAISKKLLNATEKVKNYVESWDLDEDPKPNALPNLNTSPVSKVNETFTKIDNQLSDLIPPISKINVHSPPKVSIDPTSSIRNTSYLTSFTDSFVSNEHKGNLKLESIEKVLDETKCLPTTPLVNNLNTVCPLFTSDKLESPTFTVVSSSTQNDNNFYNASPHIVINEIHDKLNTSENFPKQSVDILN